MSIIVNDPTLLSQLTTGDEVELRDPSGRVLGVFVPQGPGALPPGVQSPFTDEEMEARRKQPRTGRPLGDILRDLQSHQ